jgi:hypothetical protein
MNSSMRPERRGARRSSARVYFNKYIDGQPHLCEAVELSATGMLARRIHGPDAPRPAYAVEMAPGPLEPGAERLWLCASPVWSSGDLEALCFVDCSPEDRALLEALLARVAA